MPDKTNKRRTSSKSVVSAHASAASEREHVEVWDDHSYGRVVYQLDKARRCYLDSQLKPYGISSAHMPVLNYLWEGHDGDTQSAIADVLGVDPATVTRVAQKLEALGYISRRISGRDTRALHLSLTRSGWNLAESVRSVSASWASEITAHLSPRRRGEILRALERITLHAQNVCAAAKVDGGNGK